MRRFTRSGREPKDRSERMILNNYRALQFMREEIGDSLSPEAVLELHRIVTDGTLNEPDDAEQFLHPVIRGVLLHFWLAYDHPFEDEITASLPC